MLRGVSVIALGWWMLAASLTARADDIPSLAEPAESAESVETVAVYEDLDTVVVTGRIFSPAEQVVHRVAEAARLLRDVPLHYTYVKRFRGEALRGRPVAFAAWSERSQSWHMVEIEVPFPAPRLRPGRSLTSRVLTPGYQARHVRGVGTERLTFDIYQDTERLQVYGRKYPVLELPVVKKLGIRAAVANAEVTYYLPVSDDSAPLFAAEGQALLRSNAEAALQFLRERQIPSFAYPGKLLADIVLPETLMALAVIEQTDDGDFFRAPAMALEKTLGHYGLMQTEAFTYSVSSARAAGPMQFTDRRGRGTYSMVVRRCAGAELDPDFDTGARDLLNATKAAACLLDLELAGMSREVQDEYALSPAPLSIVTVAAYNGGGRNAKKLLLAVRRLKAKLGDLRIPDSTAFESLTTRCPCLWLDRDGKTTGLRIPSYNRENIGYVDKYLRFISQLRAAAVEG
jgi:hypothetical protein